jgi:hypothetical protein
MSRINAALAGSCAAGLIASLCCGGSLVFASIGLGAFWAAFGLSRYLPQVLATGALSIIAINYLFYRRAAARISSADGRGRLELRRGMFLSAAIGWQRCRPALFSSSGSIMRCQSAPLSRALGIWPRSHHRSPECTAPLRRCQLCSIGAALGASVSAVGCRRCAGRALGLARRCVCRDGGNDLDPCAGGDACPFLSLRRRSDRECSGLTGLPPRQSAPAKP